MQRFHFVCRPVAAFALFAWSLAALPITAQENRPGPASPPRFAALSNLEAWIQLPQAGEGVGEELPAWAKVLAASLPNTTARMLELDYLHRELNPLSATLRGKVRRAVAKANRCDYSTAYAEADLARAGLTREQIESLDNPSSRDGDADAAAVSFARKLTLAGDTVTDEEVAQLAKAYGDKQLVALVLLVAHANFQDRLFLSLGIHLEPGEPMPPVKIVFAQGEAGMAGNIPKRTPPVEHAAETVESRIADAPWLSLDVPALQAKMQAQQARPGRIRVPTWEEISRDAPAEVRKRPMRIRWSLVCHGYQPELAGGWGACMGTFGVEANQDRVFEESLFWVITREINCFY